MVKSRLTATIAVLSALHLLATPSALADDKTIEIKNVPLGELRSELFSVDRNLSVRVEAVGGQWEGDDHMFAYPWIIDAKKRGLVWSMDEEISTGVKGSHWLRRYDERLDLRPGTYQLYFYAGRSGFLDGADGLESLSEALKALGRWLDTRGKEGKDSKFGTELSEKCFVRLTSDAGGFVSVAGPVSIPPVISLLDPGENTFLSRGFTLTSDADFEVYSVGEYSRGGDRMVDWGWIIDARTRDRVWEMTEGNTDWAGGAEKNRRFHDRVRFRAGDYVAFYVTDDSHSPESWNADPPYDPDSWGLQIVPLVAADRAKVKPFAESRQPAAIVRVVGVGDNELKSAAFRVSKPSALRVYAIGEEDRFNDCMADYAWIVRASRSAKIWTMTPDNTQPAGGAEKNRLFDGVVAFEPGDYVVYYASDGSHSYGGGWNSAPPYDQKSYGVTIFRGDSSDASAQVINIAQTDIPKPNVLADITPVHNDEERKASFSLTSPTRVHIHAVGEGTRGGMADYGWIENDLTGDVVWEMTYRKTVHAGGAEKNRSVDQTILLDKGEYFVHYATDGSHAFGDWNSAPPDDPASWGIIVTRAEKPGDQLPR